MEQIDLSPWELWSHAIFWTIIGIALYKSWHYKKGYGFWAYVKDNLIDVIRGILLTLVVVKLGAVVIQLLGFVGIDFSGIESVFDEIGVDPVKLSLVVAVGAQYLLDKRRKKLNISSKTVNPDPPKGPPKP